MERKNVYFCSFVFFPNRVRSFKRKVRAVRERFSGQEIVIRQGQNV